ncbi:hypothetical protein [Rubritalea tangerina]|uniref:hypothetical protein n=1 Tax=Rubritalea tangerina TaxID=430798 RepID=UPI003618D078
MNIMKIIIGSTFALLIACLFISYSSMKQGVINNPEELEIARLEKRQAQLEAALAKGAANSPSFENTFTPQNPLEKAAQTQADMNELQRVREELKELKEARDAIEDKAAEVIEDALEATPSPKKGRANLVKTALVMARVTDTITSIKLQASKSYVSAMSTLATSSVSAEILVLSVASPSAPSTVTKELLTHSQPHSWVAT